MVLIGEGSVRPQGVLALVGVKNILVNAMCKTK